jgi:8-oxo-dGTP diphosphatase
MAYTYEYPRPSVTVDGVVFGYEDAQLKLLLIQRGIEPFKGAWALPGGFVQENETLDDAARREVKEETNVDKIYLEQLYTFGDLERDPRGRVISVAYLALVRPSAFKLRATTDATHAEWFEMNALPKLAFDHKHIVHVARERIRGKVRYQPIGFELLPEKFSLTDLQKLYETILDTELDKRNFRKKLLAMELVIALGEYESDASHRPAELYKFDKAKYKALQKKGFYFEL